MNTNNISIRDDSNAVGSKAKYLLLLNVNSSWKIIVIEIAVPAIENIINCLNNISLFPNPNNASNRYIITGAKHNSFIVNLFMIKLVCYYI